MKQSVNRYQRRQLVRAVFSGCGLVALQPQRLQEPKQELNFFQCNN